MTLSIIAMLHDSPDYLEEFYTRVSTAAWILAGEDYELIIFYNGPGEPGPAIVNAVTAQDSHLVFITPTQTGAAQAGLMKALTKAAGDKIFIIEINSREDPEWMLAFSAAMDENQGAVIYAVQDRPGTKWWEAIFAVISNLFGKRGGKERDQLSAIMMSAQFRDALIASPNPALLGQRPIPLPGFRQQPFSVIVNEREDGTP